MKNRLILLLLLSSFALVAQQSAEEFKAKIKTEVKYQYLLFKASNDYHAKDGKFPLLIFLHGSGERGTDISLVKKHGPPKMVEEQDNFPFYVLSPQCPTGQRWDALGVKALIDKIVKDNPIDKNRIYLTGLSMGGFGTWDLAIKYPDYFAAIAPVCGGGFVHAFQAEQIKHLPIWVFHGALDNVVPVESSVRIVRALEALEADVQFTIYPKAWHDSWTETYANDELYLWFLGHELGKKE